MKRTCYHVRDHDGSIDLSHPIGVGMDFVVGFDPHPIKLGWSVIGLIAVVYALRNLFEADARLRWAADPSTRDQATARRLTIGEGHVLIHRILCASALCAFATGLASVLSPPSPASQPDHLTLGFI